MKKNKPLILLFLLVIASCTNRNNTDSQKTDYPKIIHLNLSEATSDSMNLSVIAEKVEYIPFQTTDSPPLENLNDLTITKDGYFIRSESGVLRYDTKGNYLNSLFEVGRGPEEASAQSFAIDEMRKLVYVYDQNNKVKIYNFKGSFIGKINIPISPSEYWIWSIAFFKNNLFISTAQRPNVKYLYSCFNLMNDSIKVICKNYRGYEKSQENKMPLTPQDYSYEISDSSILYKERFCDTIFNVSKDFVQVPRFLIDLGSSKLDWEGWRNHGMFDIAGGPPFGYQVQSFIETRYFLFIVLTSFKEPEKFAYWNKKSNSIKIFMNKGNSMPFKQIFLRNDLDKLVAFAPMNQIGYLSYYDNCLYSIIEAKDFAKAYRSASEETKNSTKYLKTMAPVLNSITEFSNPVIMKVNLK